MKTTATALLVLSGMLAFGQEAGTGPKRTGSELIDRHIRAKWEDLGLKPASKAEDAEFVRRVYLDVIGRIPSLSEVERFLGDTSADKRRKVVDELLASETYATNWAGIWAGILIGYDADAREEQARVLVAKSAVPVFAKNTPFDVFARDFMTAKGQTPYRGQKDAGEETNPATIFYVRYQKSAGKDLPAAVAGKFSRTFLGTQIQCAQCHDHPFDVWTQEDFYGMAAFMQGIAIKREKVDEKIEYYTVDDRPRKKRGSDGIMIPESKTQVPIAFLQTKEKPKEGEGLREAFARMMTSPANLQFARATVNRYWAHFFGRGFVNPVDEFNGKNKPTHPELLEELAKDFVEHKFDLQYLIRAITGSQAYQLTSAARKREAQPQKYFALGMVRPMSPEQILHSVVTACASDATANTLRRDQDLAKAIRDFRYAFGDDEGAETVSFEGTIPAALLMMNSQIIDLGVNALKSRKGTTRLGEILAAEKAPAERIRKIYLAALSRVPRAEETARAVRYVASKGDSGDAYEDVMWALLNSSEFLLNH